jgi:phospholipase A1
VAAGPGDEEDQTKEFAMKVFGILTVLLLAVCQNSSAQAVDEEDVKPIKEPGVEPTYPGGVDMAMQEAMKQCLLAQFEIAGEEETVGQLRSVCTEAVNTDTAALEVTADPPRGSAVSIRRDAYFDNRSRQFVMSPYRANYIIYTYNSDPNEDPFQVEPTDFLEDDEAKFQVSFKVPVATGLFGGNTDLLFAYTSVAWWQVLNDDISNPFRETNYEPEIFLRNHSNVDILGLNFVNWEFGVNHQSNGQSEPTSRGWDRAIGATSIELTDDLVLGLRAWHVLDTQENNSDIEDYMGYGDISLGWAPNRNTFTLMYRPATDGDAVQLTWSYPISKYLRLYAQYWNGHGESLIDYDVHTERFGIGIALNDVIARD